ncbi:hypothetical protein [Burkholderia sp. Ac-20344]|uniref:hypothetical protein n=1 Tax=Burkholderia sp. Ac-20344 TaxID=2703890 RepID=UPI001F120481|nr:hypothetical protein [Burkholderia sp. Ac-20344]
MASASAPLMLEELSIVFLANSANYLFYLLRKKLSSERDFPQWNRRMKPLTSPEQTSSVSPLYKIDLIDKTHQNAVTESIVYFMKMTPKISDCPLQIRNTGCDLPASTTKPACFVFSEVLGDAGLRSVQQRNTKHTRSDY